MLGPEEHLRTFTREAIVAFRERRWAGARGGAFVVGNLDHVPRDGAGRRAASSRFPTLPAPEPYEPAPGSRPSASSRSATRNQSHLRMIYRPEVDVDDRRRAPR